jgi:hypothetical protein
MFLGKFVGGVLDADGDFEKSPSGGRILDGTVRRARIRQPHIAAHSTERALGVFMSFMRYLQTRLTTWPGCRPSSVQYPYRSFVHGGESEVLYKR